MAFSYYHIVASVNTHIINKRNTAVLLLEYNHGQILESKQLWEIHTMMQDNNEDSEEYKSKHMMVGNRKEY